MSRLFHQVARLTFIGTAVSGAGRFIYLVFVGRFLGPALLGDISVLLSIVVMIGGFIQLSVGDAATKFVAESCGNNDVETGVKQYSGLVTLSLFLIAISGILMITINTLLGGVLYSTTDIALLFLLVGGFALYILTRAGLYGFGFVKEYSALEVVFNIGFLLLTYILIIMRPEFVIVPLFLLYFGISGIGLVILYAKHMFHLSYADSHSLIISETSIMKFVGLTSIIGLTGLVNSSAPVVMSFFLSSSEIGFYAAASSFMVFVTFLPLVFNRTTLPTISYKFGTSKKEDVRQFVNRSFKVVTESQIFFPLSLVLLSSVGLLIMYGSGYNGSILTLRLLSINAFVSGIASYLYNVLAGTNNVKKGVWASVLSTITILIIWFSLIPIFGIVGAALALLTGSLVRLVLMAYWTHAEYPLSIETRTVALIVISITLVITGIILESIFPIWGLFILIGSETLLIILLIKPSLSAFRKIDS